MSRRRRAQEENNGVVGQPFDLEGEDLDATQHAEVWFDTSKWTQAQVDEQLLGPMAQKLAAGPS